ncbi:hypothetical protein PT286_06205 [Neisseriaceae bacterium ESL0693]|nr:hypothetical protein [Neisseriaceae bacterium ESL0693]
MTDKHAASLAEQRELLNLHADSLRLKIMAAQMKARHVAPKSSSLHWGLILALLDMLPLSGLVMKLSRKSKKGRNKLLLAGLSLGMMWLTQKFKSPATKR